MLMCWCGQSGPEFGHGRKRNTGNRHELTGTILGDNSWKARSVCCCAFRKLGCAKLLYLMFKLSLETIDQSTTSIMPSTGNVFTYSRGPGLLKHRRSKKQACLQARHMAESVIIMSVLRLARYQFSSCLPDLCKSSMQSIANHSRKPVHGKVRECYETPLVPLLETHTLASISATATRAFSLQQVSLFNFPGR